MRGRCGKGAWSGLCACALVVGVAWGAWVPVSGQGQALRVVMKSEIVEVEPEGDAGATQAGMMAMGPMMKQMLMPEGVVEFVTLASGDALRMEYRNAMALFPKGSIVLRPSGSDDMFVLDSVQKTFFKAPGGAAGRMSPMAGMGVEPQVTVTPTGETDTIAGHQAERATVEMRLSGPAGTPGMPGMAGQMTVSGDIWFADGLLTDAEARAAGKMLQAIPMMGGAGANTLAKPGRVVLRSRARMSISPRYEFRTEVSSVDRVSADANLFVVPPDYREVPMPMPQMPGR
jgi:hypothetical protein